MGFDFLGFHVRQYPVGRYQTGRAREGVSRSFNTLMMPSRAAQQKHRRQLKHIIRQYRGAPVDDLIRKLNPVIKGWSNYYRTVVSIK